MSTYNLCFEQKCEKYENFLSENFHFLVVKFSIYLNRRIFIMIHTFLVGKKHLIWSYEVHVKFGDSDQPVHQHSLIRTFTVCLYFIQPNYSTVRVLSFFKNTEKMCDNICIHLK